MTSTSMVRTSVSTIVISTPESFMRYESPNHPISRTLEHHSQQELIQLKIVGTPRPKPSTFLKKIHS